MEATTWLDTFNDLTLDAADTYYIEVMHDGAFGIPDGVEYDLHVSLEKHPIASFTFSPSPVFEDELGNNTFQNLDHQDNFSAFFDPAIGNQEFGGTVNYLTPYASVVAMATARRIPMIYDHPTDA